MVTSINKGDFYTDDRIAAEYAVVKGVFNALLSSGNVFLRDYATNDLIFPLEAFAIFERLDLKYNVTVLALTPGLSDELALGSRRFSYSLTISDLRTPNLDFNIELPAEAVYDNLQVEFSHTCYYCLTCFMVCSSSKCRVFF